MKTSDQIYDEVEARWSAEEAQRRLKRHGRAFDVLLMAILWAAVFGWALVGREKIVLMVSPLLLIGSLVQLQKRWRLEERVEQLEKMH